MLKLNEEAPQALAVVLSGQAPGLEALPASVVVRWGRAPVTEAHGWPPPHGIMCIPVQGFLDLAGLQTPEAPLILGAPSIRVTPIISNERRVLVGLGGLTAMKQFLKGQKLAM
jgi:hypothetical protein